MPHIIATERALYWAVGEPVVAAGLIELLHEGDTHKE